MKKSSYAFSIIGLIVASLATISAHAAACAPGSVSHKANLYNVTIVNNMLTYQDKIGTVNKKAVLRADCSGYTDYTVATIGGLPYPPNTVFSMVGKVLLGTTQAATVTVMGGMIASTVRVSGVNTGINSDLLRLNNGGITYMAVKQPWS